MDAVVTFFSLRAIQFCRNICVDGPKCSSAQARATLRSKIATCTSAQVSDAQVLIVNYTVPFGMLYRRCGLKIGLWRRDLRRLETSGEDVSVARRLQGPAALKSSTPVRLSCYLPNSRWQQPQESLHLVEVDSFVGAPSVDFTIGFQLECFASQHQVTIRKLNRGGRKCAREPSECGNGSGRKG